MAASAAASVKAVERASAKDVGFAVGIVFILTVLFLPLPATFIDIGLSFSIALAVLILMVSLWIQRPLDFSAFPTVLLLATLLRLALNIATTRLILSNGSEGPEAAGHVIAGFANFVMSGDFVIGTIVFVILILVTVVALAAYLNRLYGPITALSNVQVDVMTALVSFDRVFEVLDLEPAIGDRPSPNIASICPSTDPARNREARRQTDGYDPASRLRQPDSLCVRAGCRPCIRTAAAAGWR